MRKGERMLRTRLGENGPVVTNVAVGTSPLGGMPDTYGYDVPEDRAIATVREFLRSPLDFIDTSNEYGDGESERRIGAALAEGPARPDLVIATKIDPARGSSDFSAERVRASFDESIARLGVDRVDVLYLHDPERFSFSEVTAPGGALDAVIELRESGRVSVVGVAGGDISEMRRYLDTGRLDVLLNHSRYNLLDTSADALIDHALDAGVSFVNAAPYGSGILAKPSSSGARFQYRDPTDAVVAEVETLREQSARFDVPLAALALQFSTRDPRISSTVVGVSSPSRVAELVRNAELEIPDDLWRVVDELQADRS
jgi:D-threo-aldose 1-dehydrogenase